MQFNEMHKNRNWPVAGKLVAHTRLVKAVAHARLVKAVTLATKDPRPETKMAELLGHVARRRLVSSNFWESRRPKIQSFESLAFSFSSYSSPPVVSYQPIAALPARDVSWLNRRFF